MVLRNASVPQFLARTDTLVSCLRSLKASNFKTLMSISASIATRTEEEYQNYEMSSASPTLSKYTQSGLLFDGPAYRGLDCATLGPSDIDFCQDHIRFLSGLYGLLRPSDNIQCHRLEMGTVGLPFPDKSSNLYQFWGPSLIEKIEEELRPDSRIPDAYKGMLLNCASEEYFKVVSGLTKRNAGIRIVTCSFTDKGKVVSVYAKRARGLMARFVGTDPGIRAAIQSAALKGGDKCGEEKILQALKAFNSEGYAFSSSSEDEKNGVLTLIFNRAGSAPATVPYAAAPGSAAATLALQEQLKPTSEASAETGSKVGGGSAIAHGSRKRAPKLADSGSSDAGEVTNKKQKKVR
jgi:cytoplasmic iron level regulating protein YaaA (DUF328/UPF0246 family)